MAPGNRTGKIMTQADEWPKWFFMVDEAHCWPELTEELKRIMLRFSPKRPSKEHFNFLPSPGVGIGRSRVNSHFGYRHSPDADWRKKGQAAGAQANREKARTVSKVIIELARNVWADKPRLKNNMLATAREIERKKDERLKRGAFSYLGVDAIRKHLARHLNKDVLRNSIRPFQFGSLL